MLAGTEVFITIQDKTTRVKDWSVELPQIFKTFKFTFNDHLGSRIAEKNVWFIEKFNTASKRKAAAGASATAHRS